MLGVTTAVAKLVSMVAGRSFQSLGGRFSQFKGRAAWVLQVQLWYSYFIFRQAIFQILTNLAQLCIGDVLLRSRSFLMTRSRR